MSRIPITEHIAMETEGETSPAPSSCSRRLASSA